WNGRGRGDCGGQHEHRNRVKESRRRVRLHRALAEELREIAVGLEKPSPLPALEPSLELLDRAGDERPEQHEQRHLDEHEGERPLAGHPRRTPKSSSATNSVPSTNAMY